MKILSFGYIPSNFGGRQSSGLANVIYQLAYHVAKLNGVEMILAATDVFVPELHKDGLTILGWTKGMLIKHALMHPVVGAKILVNTFCCKTKYSPLVSILGIFFMRKAWQIFTLPHWLKRYLSRTKAEQKRFWSMYLSSCKCRTIFSIISGVAPHCDNLASTSATQRSIEEQ